MKTDKERCSWCGDDPLYIKYHDEEWGIPLKDDQKLFELLILEGMQAGLSWITVLRKRENFRKAFDNFDYKKIVKYDQEKIENLLHNEGIIRNHLKINAAVQNAKMFMNIQKEFGTFSSYIWQFVDGSPIKNRRNSIHEIPSKTPESDKMSKDLQKRGFKFVGSTICYAFMQASGMVDDHTLNCFKRKTN